MTATPVDRIELSGLLRREQTVLYFAISSWSASRTETEAPPKYLGAPCDHIDSVLCSKPQSRCHGIVSVDLRDLLRSALAYSQCNAWHISYSWRPCRRSKYTRVHSGAASLARQQHNERRVWGLGAISYVGLNLLTCRKVAVLLLS
jgi:hypothetical protein